MEIIETIQNTKKIDETIQNTDEIIKIIFCETAQDIFNNFIELNNSQKEIYILNNYKLGIDIVEENFNIYIFLIDCIESSNDKINKSKYHNLIKPLNIWNICICDNIMFNYPFTMEQHIYMPLKYISECFNNNSKNKLMTTLIHEKIHISQRLYENIWEKFILENDKKWIKIYNNDLIYLIIINNINNNLSIIDLDKYEFIINPDSEYKNFKYVYKINNDYHYAHYVFDITNKKIKILFFNIDIKNKTLKLIENLNINNEHPYEEFAYMISEEIMKKY